MCAGIAREMACSSEYRGLLLRYKGRDIQDLTSRPAAPDSNSRTNMSIVEILTVIISAGELAVKAAEVSTNRVFCRSVLTTLLS